MVMATTMNLNMVSSTSLWQRSGLFAPAVVHSRAVNFSLKSQQSLPLAHQFTRRLKPANQRVLRGNSCGAVRRATTTAFADVETDTSVGKEEETSTSELLCCPICFEPLSRKGPTGLNLAAVRRSGFSCGRCRKGYSNRDVYLDLTLLTGSQVYEESRAPGTEIFRSPWVSFVYERGWRQNFARSGFPGADEEFKMAQNFLKSTVGGVLVDVSCGSGLFTRRFAQSGDYEAVVAVDFSENMLRQSYEFIKQDQSLSSSNIALVRADVARLPFATGSVDAVHAGAALHCWPSPSAGMSEISRILKPGGVFVATTFLTPYPIFDFGSKELRKVLKDAVATSTIKYWDEDELEDLCRVCGLVGYSRIRRNNFIMLTARKPDEAE